MNPNNQDKNNPKIHQKQSDDYQDTADGALRIGGSGQNFIQNTNFTEEEKQSIIRYIDELKYAEKRDNALIELSRQREHFAELAPFIWHSVGTIAALLQEIVAVYPQLSPPNLDTKTSNKACNVLALLQCVASHKETRQHFLKAHIPLFLYPFLNTVSKGRPFEYLRLTSLGVIGALVKMDDSDVISFLLQTEIIPLCLRIMERGTELSQTVATFIIQKILFDEQGLSYLCQTAERFFAVSTVLNNMVQAQTEKSSSRLLKHIIRCYNRLAENIKARAALKENIPLILKEIAILDCLDDSSKKCLKNFNEAIFNSNDQDVSNAINEGGLFLQQYQSSDAFSNFSKQSELTNLESLRNQTAISEASQLSNNIGYNISSNNNFNSQNLNQQVIQQPSHNQMYNSRPGSTINEQISLQAQQNIQIQRMTMASPSPMNQGFIPKTITPSTLQNLDPASQGLFYQQAVNNYQFQGNNLFLPQPTHSNQTNFIPQFHSPSPHQQNFLLQQQTKQQQYQHSQFGHQYQSQPNSFSQQLYDPTATGAQLHQLYGNPSGSIGFSVYQGQN
eukprot:403330725